MKKAVKDRITIIVDGQPRRLVWVAEHRPDILLRALCGDTSFEYIGKDAILSAFARIGLRRLELEKLIESHPEWENDGINLAAFWQA